MKAPSAVSSDNSKCVAIVANNILNVRFGISAGTRAKIGEDTGVKVLIQRNTIRNVSGDFIRPIAGDIIVDSNQAFDGYLSTADKNVNYPNGDENHDDFIQGFALPVGIEYSNVKITNNYFLETTDPKRRFNASYQGISVFDGLYSNFTISRNVVLASAYHGISMYWGKNGLIENNTVQSIYLPGKRNCWIKVTPSKVDPVTKSAHLTENVIVRNNVATYVKAEAANPGAIFTNNFAVTQAMAPAVFTAFDLLGSSFDLRPKVGSVIYGKGVGARN